MKSLSEYQIIIKIYGIVFVALMGIIGIVVINDYQNNKVYEAASYATVNTVPSVLAMGNALAQFYGLRVAVRDHILNEDELKSSGIEKEIQKYTESIEKTFSEYEQSLLSNNEDKQLLILDKFYFEAYVKSLEFPLALSLKNKNTQARDELANRSDIALKFDEALNSHLDFNKKLAVEVAKNALTIKESSTQLSLIIAAFILSFVSLIGCIVLLFSKRNNDMYSNH